MFVLEVTFVFPQKLYLSNKFYIVGICKVEILHRSGPLNCIIIIHL
jgi:hypothetical protein